MIKMIVSTITRYKYEIKQKSNTISNRIWKVKVKLIGDENENRKTIT